MANDSKVTLPFDIDRVLSMSKEAIIEALYNGDTFAAILGISDDTMEELYAIAVEVMEAGHKEEASDALFFLSTVCMYNGEIWLRYGTAEQALGQYPTALQAYQMAAILQPLDPFPFIYAAQ